MDVRLSLLLMKHLGIEIDVRNLPELDQEFLPLYKFNTAFLKTAKKPVSVAVERAGGQMATYHTLQNFYWFL